MEDNNKSWNHNLKFYAGILSVISLAHLHFKSEPGHDEDHALSRSRWSNYLYTAWLAGICYKMFLYNYDSGNYNNNQRNLGGEGDDGYEYGAADDDENNTVNSYYEQMEEHEQETANLFSWSLALVLI